MSSFSELDAELQDLMDLEAQERGESGFLAANPGRADLDPELADLMDAEARERGESS